jgi:S-adenosylmethionine-dependent methyltransferase
LLPIGRTGAASIRRPPAGALAEEETMAELRRPRSVSSNVLLRLLLAQLGDWGTRHGITPAESTVIDLGGGTGGLASSLALQGYRVTVVDPSPDALASLERRTAEAGLEGRIEGRQGDTSDLVQLAGQASADLVICHRVLEVVEAPEAAVAAIAEVLRPGGALSLTVSQRRWLVLSQALAGHFALARRTFAGAGRLDHDHITALLEAVGLRVLASHGIGALADHVSEATVEAETGAYDELTSLELEISQDPPFRSLAPLLHVFAERGERVG